MAESNSRITWEGCSVLLDVNDGDRLVFARLSPNASIKIGNKKCALKPLIGCPFGSLFRVETGPAGGAHLSRCVPSSSADASSMQEIDELQSKYEAKDNRDLIDNNTAQGLSSGDIDAMRSEGATGDEIVDALIANSSTFGKKTTFSQEKYKLKKQKKYAPKVLLRRPFGRRFLRVDTLSLLLSLGNVSAYSDVLVVDMVGGILAGAVAERLGGTGYVCSTYFGSKSGSLDIARIFNFSNKICSRILQAPFSDFFPTESNDDASSELNEQHSSEFQSSAHNMSLASEDGGAIDVSEPNQERCSSIFDQQDDTRETVPMGIQRCTTRNVNGTHESTASSMQKSVNPGRRASSEAIKSWKENGFTSLIVAAPEMEVETIVQQLLPLLSYSAPFAIYHQYLQPLATCMHKIQTSKMAIGLQISEPWLREYQVLPSRTHPHMQMSGFGGYILSGTRIANSESFIGN